MKTIFETTTNKLKFTVMKAIILKLISINFFVVFLASLILLAIKLSKFQFDDNNIYLFLICILSCIGCPLIYCESLEINNK